MVSRFPPDSCINFFPGLRAIRNLPEFVPGISCLYFLGLRSKRKLPEICTPGFGAIQNHPGICFPGCLWRSQRYISGSWASYGLWVNFLRGQLANITLLLHTSDMSFVCLWIYFGHTSDMPLDILRAYLGHAFGIPLACRSHSLNPFSDPLGITKACRNLLGSIG